MTYILVHLTSGSKFQFLYLKKHNEKNNIYALKRIINFSLKTQKRRPNAYDKIHILNNSFFIFTKLLL